MVTSLMSHSLCVRMEVNLSQDSRPATLRSKYRDWGVFTAFQHSGRGCAVTRQCDQRLLSSSGCKWCFFTKTWKVSQMTPKEKLLCSSFLLPVCLTDHRIILLFAVPNNSHVSCGVILGVVCIFRVLTLPEWPKRHLSVRITSTCRIGFQGCLSLSFGKAAFVWIRCLLRSRHEACTCVHHLTEASSNWGSVWKSLPAERRGLMQVWALKSVILPTPHMFLPSISQAMLSHSCFLNVNSLQFQSQGRVSSGSPIKLPSQLIVLSSNTAKQYFQKSKWCLTRLTDLAP